MMHDMFHCWPVEHKYVKCFLCFFLFGNAAVKRNLCYNAVKHGVLASLKTLLENKLGLGGDDWGRMVSTCMHPSYSLDSAKCMPLLKITGSVIEVWNFRSQLLYNRLVSHLAAIYGKNCYQLPIVGIQFLLLKKKKKKIFQTFLVKSCSNTATRNAVSKKKKIKDQKNQIQ